MELPLKPSEADDSGDMISETEEGDDLSLARNLFLWPDMHTGTGTQRLHQGEVQQVLVFRTA